MSLKAIANPAEAFETGINAGILSDCQHDENYAGNYMFMYHDLETDTLYFKHIDTREYVKVCLL